MVLLVFLFRRKIFLLKLLTSKLGGAIIFIPSKLGKGDIMDREEILKASRKENKNTDLVEMEISIKAGNIAVRVGVIVCFLISVVARAVTGEYLLSPWAIYFSIIGTEWIVRAVKTKRKSDFIVGIFLSLIFVILFVLIILELIGVGYE